MIVEERRDLIGSTAGAVFSDCRKYRYRLWRIWDQKIEPVVFCMLNPSTADADTLDPTVRRCVGFAREWGAGGLVVINMFALRATDPRELTKVSVDDAVGADNDEVILCAAALAKEVVVAWGSHSTVVTRSSKLAAMIGPKAVCLGTNQDGSPKHPLYLPANAQRVPWSHPLAERHVV